MASWDETTPWDWKCIGADLSLATLARVLAPAEEQDDKTENIVPIEFGGTRL